MEVQDTKSTLQVTPRNEEKIKNNPQVSLKMLHFFINSGIKDTAYYWSELTRFIQKYVELKRVAPSLDSMDIGGGWPIKTNVFFDYDYQYMADQIVKNIKWMCAKNNTKEPNIFTEFGSYTVGEVGRFFIPFWKKNFRTIRNCGT